MLSSTLISYRHFGHNKTDEPADQPLMDEMIKKHPPVRKIYAENLIGGGLSEEEAEKLAAEAYQGVADAHNEARQEHGAPTKQVGRQDRTWAESVNHGREETVPLAEQLLRVP